jgi:plastocyanin
LDKPSGKFSLLCSAERWYNHLIPSLVADARCELHPWNYLALKLKEETMKDLKDSKKSDRRKFLKASGGAILAAGAAGVISTSGQHHKKVEYSVASDPLGSATVSFGGWIAEASPVLDRFTNPLPPPFPPSNHHELIPNVAKIKAGGYVNFIISGLHVVAIYDDGHQPADINAGITVPLGTPFPSVINDANRRIYRGINPVISLSPPFYTADRVEVVHFHTPGTYLVICAVLPHFNEGMFGYVRVLSGKSTEAGV